MKKRGYNPSALLDMKERTIGFDAEWKDAFGDPADTGVWIIWGNSGSGKSSFAMQLAKRLCKYFKKVVYNSMEEGISLSFRQRVAKFRVEEVRKKLVILDNEQIEELDERLSKKGAPKCVIIDSYQYTMMSYIDYKHFREKHSDKLIIFISHADGKMPEGRGAKRIMYDADVKIYVEGYRALCKGRFTPAAGVTYTIWKEGADKYWGMLDNKDQNNGEETDREQEDDYEGSDKGIADNLSQDGL